MTSRAWRLLLLAGLAAFMGEFDSSALPLALPAISADFHASLGALSNLGSVFLLGGLLAVPMAVLADRTGRRRLIAVCVLGFSLADVATAFVASVPELAACRFVAVAFEALVAAVAPVLAVEEVPAQHRALGVAGLTFLAAAGGGACTILYPFLAPHWRSLYLLGGAGLPLAAVIWWALPETRTWAAAPHHEAPLRVLLEPAWRGRLLILTGFAALAVVFWEPNSLYGVLYGSRALHLSPGWISTILVISGWVGAAGFLAGGWLSDRFGRRRLSVAFLALSAILGGQAFVGGIASYAAGFTLGSLTVGMAGPMTAAWFSELFPTRARATSQTLSLGAGTIGGVVGLQLVARVAPALGLGLALALSATGLLLAAVLLLQLPETRGQPLPD